MKNLVKFSLFSVITCAILILLDVFVFVQPLRTPYQVFYAQYEDSLDFVSIGNSTVRDGISPLEIWHEYGITGYNICAAPTHPEVIIIAINEAMRLQSPKVMYIDINGLTYQKAVDQKKFVQDYISAMPECKQKQELIKQYGYNEEDLEKTEIFAYHNNFRNPDNYIAVTKYSKGFSVSFRTQKQVKRTFDQNLVSKLPQDGVDYLYRILDTCKKYPDVNFIFGKMPRFNDESTIKENYMLRSAIPVIEEYGYKYIEWDNYIDDIGLDTDEDYRDVNHMNAKGAIKFSKYFGNYIVNNYDMTSTHSKNVINDFNGCYKKYHKVIETK